jgi:hypothetical protein
MPTLVEGTPKVGNLRTTDYDDNKRKQHIHVYKEARNYYKKHTRDSNMNRERKTRLLQHLESRLPYVQKANHEYFLRQLELEYQYIPTVPEHQIFIEDLTDDESRISQRLENPAPHKPPETRNYPTRSRIPVNTDLDYRRPELIADRELLDNRITQMMHEKYGPDLFDDEGHYTSTEMFPNF